MREMKQSGIPWIGDIPKDWGVNRLKFIADIELGKMLCNEDKGGYYKKPYLKSKNIQCLNVDVSSVDEMWFSADELKLYRLKQGDLILSEGGEVGKTCIWNNELDECYIQNSAHKVTINKYNYNRFFLYLFNAYSEGFNSIVHKISIAHLTKEKLMNVSIIIPSLPEQNTIADFLDLKCEKIDTIIALEETIISELNEYKKLIIQKAATKGISKTKMKNSGIGWVGEIPERWEVKKLKYCADVVLGKMLCNEDKGNYYIKPYLKSKNIQWLNIDISDIEEMWFSEYELKLYRLKKGDLVLSEGGEVGKTCMWNDELEECYIQNSAHKVTINKNNLNTFFLYLFHAYGSAGGFNSIVRTISIAHLTKDKLLNLQCVVPPLPEQKAIAAYLVKKTSEVDKLVSIKQQKITELKEYKKSLIYEYVTGKKEVPA
jgi:type I restriction enzyme S subunit